jgi:lysophospholipase L1-like esterase
MTKTTRCWRVLAAWILGGLVGACAAQSTTGAAESATYWVGTWTTAAQPAFPGALQRYDDRTLRLVVHASIGGEQVRVRLSNAYGRAPLHIATLHVALREHGANIVRDTDRALTFGGGRGVVVAPGTSVASDPVALSVPALSDVVISFRATGRVEANTVHALAQQTGWVSRDRIDATASEKFPRSRQIDDLPFLAGVDVGTTQPSAAIVMFGDSWVDGDGSTPDANARWTDALAARLQRAGGECAHIAVLNQGLIGNRLLHDSPARHASNVPDFGHALGESGLARFDRDVLRQPGVRAVILHLGTNDIGFDGGVAPPDEAVSADALIAGFRQLATRARRAGLRVVGSTLTPVEGVTLLPNYDTPTKEALRQEVNTWIREGGAFDGVIDVDRVVRDPTRPTRLLPELASKDHLHPNDAGYAAVASAVPLDICNGLLPR